MLGRLHLLGRELGQGLLQLLYPGVCRLCEAALPPDMVGFCSACQAALTADPLPTCPRCAATVGPFVDLSDGCTACRGQRFHFQCVQRMGPYVEPLRLTVLRLKHASGEELAEVLGILWAERMDARLRSWQADAVVPVPLHWTRRWRRGYNQSDILAQALADRLGLPCRPRWLRRIRATPQQTRQTPSARLDNVRGAFRAGKGAAGKAILLVDDVLTTGSTCNEAALALRTAGATRVLVAVLARSHG